MTKDKINKLFAAEERSGEQKMNLVRLVFIAVFFANEFLNRYAFGVVDQALHVRAAWTLFVWELFAAAAWLAVNRLGFYARWMKYAAAALDAVFLTLVLVLVEGNNGPLISMYYVLIILSAMRYSGKAILASAGLSAAGYAVVWYFSFGNPRLRPIPVYMAVLTMLIMALVGVIAGYVVRKMRGLVFRFAENLVRRELAEKALLRYVSHQVARKILDSPDGGEIMREGRRTHAAILISDIRGFTPMSEELGPEELVKLLNAYFSRMVDVVFRHNGTLDKFVGDALIVVFNDPFEQPDAEKRAVACAAEMQAEIAAFNLAQQAAGKRTLGVGIGVHCGPVIAGNVGSQSRMDYTVMGETVNFTSRLQGRAPAGAVYVSAQARERTERDFSYKSLGPMEFKGCSAPAEVFELAA